MPSNVSGLQSDGLLPRSHFEAAYCTAIFVGFQDVFPELRVASLANDAFGSQLDPCTLQDVFMPRLREVPIQQRLNDIRRQFGICLKLASDFLGKSFVHVVVDKVAFECIRTNRSANLLGNGNFPNPIGLEPLKRVLCSLGRPPRAELAQELFKFRVYLRKRQGVSLTV